MNIKEIGDWVAVLGATVAAVASVWNLLLQLRGKRDSFAVRLGGSSPSISQETMLHVVSRSDHPIKLTDWGFVEADGRFTSFLMEWEVGGLQSEEITSRGSSELEKFGSVFEAGYIRRDNVYGAYAISVTQRRPSVCFTGAMPIWRRYWIRLRLWFQPNYLAW
jgi:hypothetical protein